MGWKKSIFIHDTTTGAWDTGAHTVKCQPLDQSYPTGAVDCSALTNGYVYRQDSDLDDSKHYDVYVDGALSELRLISPQSIPMVGV